MAGGEILAAIRWWLVLFLMGATAVPLAYVAFNRLAERGYAFARMLGLLMVTYLFWLATSLGFLTNNLGSILATWLLFAVLSFAIYRRYGDGQLGQWLRAERSQILLTEVVFALVFLFWLLARARNPAITATEKPMEFAFLNAVGRSEVFPPLDPWLSGFAISYYYFGYVMTSVIARLAFVPEAIAFNLAIAWLAAGAAVGAFGLVYNLVHAAGRNDSQVGQWARLLALVAALAITVGGNLETPLEILYGRGALTNVTLTSPATNQPGNFWQWLDIRDINTAETPAAPRYDSGGWWWWRSSRVIHEYHLSGRAEEGLEPIAEYPAFSYVLGDLHPHVLAYPFAFLSLAMALSWWLSGPSVALSAYRTGGPVEGNLFLIRRLGWLRLLLTSLIVGGLSFLNTWDVLIHLFVVLGAFALVQWRANGRWDRAILTQTGVVAVLLVIPAILFYLPFYLGFRSQAGAPYLYPMLLQPTRLAHFLVIFGLPLLAIIPLLVVLAGRVRSAWRFIVGAAVGVVALLTALQLFFTFVLGSGGDGPGRLSVVAGELGLALPGLGDVASSSLQFGWALQAAALLTGPLLSARLARPWLTILLALIFALALTLLVVLFRRNDDGAATAHVPLDERERPALPFVLLLILTGVLLTLGPEFVFLRDNFGFRLNTIFKFYYQAWAMLGVAGAAALYIIARERRLVGLVTAGVYTAVFLASLAFPVLAVNSRSREYQGLMGGNAPLTLDGLAYVAHLNPDEYAALMWLQSNVEGSPVVVEAVGGQYSNFARVAANTGLPTILGWAGHEYQWRGDTPEPATRDPIVRQIYEARDLPTLRPLLDTYRVSYIYVGDLEQRTYGPNLVDNLGGVLPIAYQNNTVTIYEWLPDTP